MFDSSVYNVPVTFPLIGYAFIGITTLAITYVTLIDDGGFSSSSDSSSYVEGGSKHRTRKAKKTKKNCTKSAKKNEKEMN